MWCCPAYSKAPVIYYCQIDFTQLSSLLITTAFASSTRLCAAVASPLCKGVTLCEGEI